ncbi:endonuclease/exonuclease/phosphatase family protein [Formosa undariae]|uniref:Endonuclease/exonuclease/phosphatase family protein n=1 Tax=Formosa undariae TaxID=1325436 RepID=A0ABV5F5H9_9FLAO
MIQLIFKYKAKAYLLFWYAFLLLIHFVLKDRISPLIFFFYACPLIVVIAYGFLVSLCLYKHKVLCIFLLCLNSLLVVYWFNNYHYKNENPPINKTISTQSIFYWNISRPDHLPLDIIFENIKSYNPNIVVLVEAKDISKTDLATFKNHYPTYQIQQLEGEMFIAVNGKINTVHYNKITRGSKSNLVNATINEQPINILITDLLANPALSKKEDLTRLLDIAESKQVDFIVGDFNTPYISYYFDAFKTQFESFHEYNTGYTGTWPRTFPILEIDHIWLNKKWQPITLHKEFHTNSDHGFLIGSYQFKL